MENRKWKIGRRKWRMENNTLEPQKTLSLQVLPLGEDLGGV
jgi:hypothetical protein